MSKFTSSSLKAAASILTATLGAIGVANADQNNYGGVWENINSNTRGVTKIIIDPADLGVAAYGSCSPSDCYWGEVQGDYVSETTGNGNGLSFNITEGNVSFSFNINGGHTSDEYLQAIYHQGFATKEMRIRMDGGDELVVDVFSDYHDNRDDTAYQYRFRKVNGGGFPGFPEIVIPSPVPMPTPTPTPQPVLPFPIPFPNIVLPVSFEGVWDTSFGQLKLHKVGDDYVVGQYADKGIIVGKQVGGCVSGVFTNNDRAGNFQFDITGDEFEGRWQWEDGRGGSWTGDQINEETNNYYRGFARNGGAMRSIANGRTDFNGSYSSSYGPIRVIAQDLFLIADYGNRGIVAGLWDGTSYQGIFTNEERVGWIDWGFNTRTTAPTSGTWGWYGEGEQGEWDLTERREYTPRLNQVPGDLGC